MCKELSTACNACPWRVDSPRGWLGASSPVEFLQQSEAEWRMPCHLHVDYEQADKAPQCAGRAIHMANRCKVPMNPELIKAQADRKAVFSNPQDFIDHHSIGAEKPVIMIVMGQVSVIGSKS